VYATVLNAGTNTDGHKEQGITYPSGQMQKALIQRVYKEAGINPLDVTYVEAHGTGTKVGDPQEVNSIADFFCAGRKTPLLIGSVKSNMGHAEPASGVASLAKVIIAMESGVIPGNLHFKEPNKDIPALSDGRLKVVDKNTPWKGGLVAINSFGFGGANAHVVLRSNTIEKVPAKPVTPGDGIPRLVTVSGRTSEAVNAIFDQVKENCERQVSEEKARFYRNRFRIRLKVDPGMRSSSPFLMKHTRTTLLATDSEDTLFLEVTKHCEKLL